MHKVTTKDDGTRMFCCPQDGTWGPITNAQYHGETPMKCPHPLCGWSGKINLAAEAQANTPQTTPPQPF